MSSFYKHGRGWTLNLHFLIFDDDGSCTEARLGCLDSLQPVSCVSSCLTPCMKLLPVALTDCYVYFTRLIQTLHGFKRNKVKGLLTDISMIHKHLFLCHIHRKHLPLCNQFTLPWNVPVIVCSFSFTMVRPKTLVEYFKMLIQFQIGAKTASKIK